MVPYKCYFSARSAKGRIQGGAKIGHEGPLLQQTSSSDKKATETKQMHSSDLEACGNKCCYFCFHSEVKFFMRFWRLFWLVTLPYFYAISIDFYAVKCLIYTYFVFIYFCFVFILICVISMFVL